MRFGLRSRFFLVFAGFAAIFAVAGGVVGVVTIRRTAIQQARDSLDLSLQAVRNSLESLSEEWSLLMSVVGNGHWVGRALADPSASGIIEKLEGIRIEAGFDILLLTDLDGRVMLRTTAPYSRGDLLRDEIMEDAFQGKSVSGIVLLDRQRLGREGTSLLERADDGLALLAAAPAYGADGEQRGVLLGGILVNGSPLLSARLSALTTHDFDPCEEHHLDVFVFHGARRVFTTSIDAAPPGQAPNAMRRAVLERGGSWYGQEEGGARSLLAAAPLTDYAGDTVGIVAVFQPSGRFDRMQRSLAALYVGVGVVALIAAVLLGLHLSGRLARPIRDLAAAAEGVSRTHFAVHIEEPSGDDELRDLARNFNRMATALSIHQLRLESAKAGLVRANEQLTELNVGYLNMLGFVSHELKNVLGAITWSAQALDEGFMGPLTDSQAKLVRAIRTSTLTALAMSKNYLDLARLESGPLKVSRRACDLVDDVVGPVLEQFHDEIVLAKMALEAEVPDALPVVADPELLRVVMRNLVGNAVKYGRSGGRLRVALGAKNDWISCEVFNEGDGLTPEQLSQVFGKFSRLHLKEKGMKRSSGLGLYIVKEIIEQHGGRIWVESESGHWVRFTFTLPVSTAPSGSEA